MLGVKRRVSLVLCWDLSCFVVPFRALVVRELAASRDFGRFSVYDLFLELYILIVID